MRFVRYGLDDGQGRTEGRPLAVAALAFAVLVSMAACRGSDGAGNSATTTTSDRRTTTTLDPERASILDAYRAFWAAYQAASDPMNPEHPDLGKYATDEELRQVTSRFLARKAAGEVFRGSMELAPRITAITGDRATVVDCSFDRTGIYDARTGELKEPLDTRRALETVTMLKVDGQWKVADVHFERYGCEPEA